MGIGRFVYTPVLPFMVDALGLTKSQAGLIASANFCGYFAGALLAAVPWIGGSRRAWLLAALALSAVTTVAMSWFTSTFAFVLLRAAGGVASAFVLVFSSALVLDRLAAAGQGRWSAVHFAGVGVGIAVSAVVVSALAALGQGWDSHWVVSGLVCLVALATVAVLVPDRAEDTAIDRSQAKRTDSGIQSLIAAYGLFGFGYVITATFIVAIVRDAADAASLEPVVWLVVGLAAIPSVAFWTGVAGRIGIEFAFAIACVCEAIGVAASVVWQTPGGVLLAAVLLGGTFMGITALGLIGARARSLADPRRTLALMTAAFGFGQIIGPVFAGVVFDLTGSFVLPSLVATAALLLAATLVSVDGRGAR